jgi:hypothetical protein
MLSGDTQLETLRGSLRELFTWSIPATRRPILRAVVDHHIGASTQNQAISSLLFLYREVMQ